MAGRASGELDDLRRALSAALDRIYAAAPDLLVVVGSGRATAIPDPDAVGDFAGFGLPLLVTLSGAPVRPSLPTVPPGRVRAAGPTDDDRTDAVTRGHMTDMAGASRPHVVARGDRAHALVRDTELPLSLAVGAWLLRDRPLTPPRVGRIVAADLDPDACARIGRDLAGLAPRVALLVMGDGSACRGEKSPGYADDRAPEFDRATTEAFRTGDAPALAAMSPTLAAELLAAGRAPWQVLAGAAAGTPVTADVSYDSAPYGVQYTVATWIAA
jgi:hypothetical protein